MKLLLIPDKFKGSLTSEEVSKAFIDGVQKAGVDFTYKFIKASDGGDGFMDAVASYKPCISVEVVTENPLGKPLRSHYLYNKKDNAAYIELANASGMELLKPEERNPMLTSTYGTGLQIKDAVQKGIKNIYIGLGGSATNDGGMGIARALGYVFLDAKGKKLPAIGNSLEQIRSIDDSWVGNDLKEVSFYAVNDVSNPLFGIKGAAYVYAGQKGATYEIIKVLDQGLENLDRVVAETYGLLNAHLPGSGAAGGAAYGLKTFLGANFLSGIDFILGLSGVEKLLAAKAFDFIVTGEGKIDDQTMNGKLLQGVMRIGEKYNTRVIAICGKLDISKNQLMDHGIYDVFEIQNPSKDLAYNLQNAKELLSQKAKEFFLLRQENSPLKK
ncbi:glycerate kinase [Maribacter sp. MAR_2009_72]|uniref:glycerate kinase n=1 Tax=Maribacter sp. MAR_2009_72 TaxID=1250050 RepID=UPI00119C0A0F|nr:glycerate kinase [Maribacter sp. MAR_2009_72]TVZ15755.1 glycerate kinase [Maribacter sp. MAR_2009_72]